MLIARYALVAQLVEHLICNQGVGSSSLSGGTINLLINMLYFRWLAMLQRKICCQFAISVANSRYVPAVIVKRIERRTACSDFVHLNGGSTENTQV